MVAWARVLVHRFSEMGVEVEATWSDEQPIAQREKKKSSVRILFYAPLRKHACLALRLGARAVEVSVEIYPSVHARAVADELARSLDGLPDQFCLGPLAGEPRATPPRRTCKSCWKATAACGSAGRSRARWP